MAGKIRFRTIRTCHVSLSSSIVHSDRRGIIAVKYIVLVPFCATKIRSICRLFKDESIISLKLIFSNYPNQMVDAGLKIILFRAVSFAVVALLSQNGLPLVLENDTLQVSRKQTSKTTSMSRQGSRMYRYRWRFCRKSA